MLVVVDFPVKLKGLWPCWDVVTLIPVNTISYTCDDAVLMSKENIQCIMMSGYY